MKVLHILSSSHLGGAEVICLNLAEAHHKHGIDARVLCLDDGAPRREALARGILQPLDADLTVSRTESNLARRTRFGQILAHIVKQERPDLVHSHVPLTNLLSHSVLTNGRVPWVCTIHGSWRQFAYSPQTVKKPWLRGYLLARHALGDYWTTRSARKVIANSQYVARELALIGVSRRKIDVIYNGLEWPQQSGNRTALRTSLGIPADMLVVGAAGHLAPVKGFDILIRAFSGIRSQNARLLIVGGDVQSDSSTRISLERLVERLGIGNRVSLLGQRALQSEFFPALDVFVVSSRTEGFSLVLLQAMQNGLPSIVTSAGGCVEVARPGIESLSYLSPYSHDLRVQLDKLLEDSSLRQQLAKSAAERARIEFSLKNHAEQYLNLYQCLI